MSRKNYIVASILLPLTLIGAAWVGHSILRPVNAEVMSMKKGGVMMDKKMQPSSLSGEFVAAEHPTSGAVTIVKEKGKHYVTFSDQFKSDSGPDLYVLMHRQAKPTQYKQTDYINLGKLQRVTGSQRYIVPDGVKLADYRSVAVWCREFNATFGYAPLMNSAMSN